MSNNGVLPTDSATAGFSPTAPLLATAAANRILAWPRYDQPADLDVLAREFGPALVGSGDACLCLRHDRTQDPPLDAAVAAVEAAFARALGPDASLEVLIIDDPLDGASWVSLGHAVTGLLGLPSSQDGQRRALPALLGHAPITSGAELAGVLSSTATTTTTTTMTTTAAPAIAPPPPRLSTPTSSTAAARAGKPMVSVVVPTFNRPGLLKRALASLAQQTFRDFEVLVVNDAGAAVEELVQAQASAFPITYVRHSANRDRAAARNSALAVAGGRYIAYLDDDDVFRPDHLATLVAALAQGTHKVAYSDATWVQERQTAAGQQPVRPILTRSKAFDKAQLLVANYLPISSLMHERDCLDAVGGFDEGLHHHEDWDLFIRLADRFDFLHVEKTTADISVRDDGSAAVAAEERKARASIHQRYRALVADPMLAAQQALSSGAGKPAWLTNPIAPPAPAAVVAAPVVAAPVAVVTAPVAAPSPAAVASGDATDAFLTQLVATYKHPMFGVTRYDYREHDAKQAEAAQAALNARFDHDRAIIVRHLMAAAASPTVALQGPSFPSTVLGALDTLTAADPTPAGPLEQRIDAVLAKVPSPEASPTSKRPSAALVSPSERGALLEAILDQVIDARLVPRFNDYDHLDDIVAIVKSRYAGPVDKHGGRSNAVLRVLGAIATDYHAVREADLPTALRGVLGAEHPYVPLRSDSAPPQIRSTIGDMLDELNALKADDNPQRFLEINLAYSQRQRAQREKTSNTNPWGLSILGEYEQNHHMLLRAMVDLIRTGRLTADDEVLVVGSRYADELDFFRKHLGLPRTTGLDLIADPAGGIVGGDMHAMPFPSGRFRMIYCAGTLCYSYNLRKAIAEFTRVATRPGFLFLSDSADRVAGADPLGRSDTGGIEGMIGFFHDVPYRIIGQDRGRSCTPSATREWPCLALELLPGQ